jgi:putative copper export protein
MPPAQQIVFALITFLHDLFTAAWIGGLITLGLSVWPAPRKTRGGRS